MRLIDADKLRCEDMVDGMLDVFDILEAPTVEAIPIEWIKKKLDRLKEDIKWAWYYGNTAVEKMEWTKTWIELVLLEEWRKENEGQNHNSK